jgi:DNA polymerase III subunit gamma/tau
MSYQVIARKYRPQRFEDVVGQEHVTQTLANAIKQSRIAHAYLFVGPRGTGKTTLARIFAKCLNATDGPRTDFADDDPRCREIAEGRSLDVLEIDGASNRGIEEIRELRETVRYSPATSRFKVYIIDEVHMLTKEAFNALLKTLEEPPAHVKFMFATTEAEKVLPTILSRCQRFDLRRIPTALIVKHLAHIARLENVRIEEPALYAIARGADGGMRDAESALDQLISFCGSEIVEADVLSMFGLAAGGQILELTSAILDGKSEAALRALDDLAGHGIDLGRLLSDLLRHFRNLLLFQISKGDLNLIEASETEAAALAEQAPKVSSSGLTRIMEVLTDCEGRLRETASKRILIEVALLKAIQARKALDIDEVLATLQQLRAQETGKGEIPPAAPSPAPGASPKTALTASAPSGSILQETAAGMAPPPARVQSPEKNLHPSAARAPMAENGLDELWVRLLEGMGRVSKFTQTYLLGAHPVSLLNNVFTIGFPPDQSDHIALVDNLRNRQLLAGQLCELGCGQVDVRFVVAAAPAGRPAFTPAVVEEAPVAVPAAPAIPNSRAASAPAPAPSPQIPEPVQLDKEQFKNDPLIRKALEIFKATIVEVRAPST